MHLLCYQSIFDSSGFFTKWFFCNFLFTCLPHCYKWKGFFFSSLLYRYDTEENTRDIILPMKFMTCTNYLTSEKFSFLIWERHLNQTVSLTCLSALLLRILFILKHYFLTETQICIINAMYHFPRRFRNPLSRWYGKLIFVNIIVDSTFFFF